MARRLQTKSDQALADLVVTRWEVADDQREPRISVWDRSYEDHDPQFIDKGKVTRPPHVKFPYLHRVTATQVTALMASMDANGRWLNAQPLTAGEDQHKRAEAVTEFLESQHRFKTSDINLNNRLAEERVAQMGLKYGNADFLPEFIRGKDWWTFRFHSLDPYDVWRDARHGRFYILRRVVTLAQLQNIAKGIEGPGGKTIQTDPATGEETIVDLPPRDGGRAMRVLRKLEREIRKGNIAHFGRRIVERGTNRRFRLNRVEGDEDTFDDGRVSPETDPFNQPIEVLEMYETHGDGLVAKVIADKGDGDHLVFQAEKNPYGACPVVPFIPHQVDNEYYGLGNGELIGKLQHMMSYMARGDLAMLGAAAWPPLLKTRRANIKQQYLQSLYGRVIEVNDTDRDLKYMQTQLPHGVHQIGMNLAKNIADFATGESELRQGDPSGAKSATAAAIAETFSGLTDKAILRRWTDTVEQLGHVLISMARIHLTSTELIPILGRKTIHFVEMRPEHLKGPWTVQYGGNIRGVSTSQMIAHKMQTVQAFAATGEANIREYLREIERLGGENDPDRFLMRRDDVPDVTPEEEHLALFDYGQMPQVSPRENVQQHLASHMEAFQEWQVAMQPGDPRLGKLMQHIQDTQQFMGGGGPGQNGAPVPNNGPQPFDPAQAGGPGQPGSHQPSTANVNQDRQASNQNGAPGTGTITAPGRTPGSLASNAGPQR